MANTASRLSANGSLTISGSFDEVTYNPSANVQVNLISHSQDFTQTSQWAAISLSVTSPGEIAPDRTRTAQLLTGNGVTTGYLNTTFPWVTGKTYTFSCYFKAGTLSVVTIYLYGIYFGTTGTGGTGCDFNLNTITTTPFGGATATIQSVGNGWFRCSLTTQAFNTRPIGDIGCQAIRMSAASGTLYAWGYQIEESNTATTYVATGTNAVILANNASKLVSLSTNNSILFTKGDIDEVTYNQNNSAPNRNIFQWSQNFSRGGWSGLQYTLTQNAEVAPDGTRTASLFTGVGLYGQLRYENQGYAQVGGGGFREGEIWTHSIFVKYGTQNQVTLVVEDWNFTAINGINYNWITSFNLLTGAVTGGGIPIVNQGMINVGNGWWRIWVTFRIPAVVGFTRLILQFRPGLYDGTDYTGKLTYVWGAQLEKSSSPTEYVGTSTPKNFLAFSEEYARDNNGVGAYKWYIENISVSKATIPDPNGNFTTSLISSTINGGINTCFVNQQVFDVIPNVNYTYSVYLKQGTSPTSTINFYSASPFNQLVGTITWPTIVGNTPTVSYAGGPVATTVTPAPNGWYRFSMSLTNNASTSMVCRVYVRTQGVTNVIGDTVYMWGAQMELGLNPTTYIRNGAFYSATLPLAPAAMKTTNTGNTFIKGSYDEYSKMSPITEGLIFNIDPGYDASYNPASNVITMYDTTQNRYVVDLAAGTSPPTYSSDFGGILKFTSTFGNNAWANTNMPSRIITPTSNYTMSAWVKFNRSISGLAEFNFNNPVTGAIVSPQANTGYSYGSCGTILGTNWFGNYGLFWYSQIRNAGAKEILVGFQNRVTPYNEASPQLTYTMNDSLIFFNWTHIVGVLNNAGNFAGFYVNGVLVSSTTASQIASGSFTYTFPTIRICNDIIPGGNSTGRNFDGDIGPMSIWNRALSASEIQQMYSSQRSRFGI